MADFVFNEEHQTTVELPILTQPGLPESEHFWESRREMREKGLVWVEFMSENGDDDFRTTDPSAQQLNALEFIKEHQQELLTAFYDYTKNQLYPIHKQFIDDEEIFFPQLSSVADLKKALAIDVIYVWEESKADTSYVSILFEFSGDFEHGTHLVLHQNRILGWEEDNDNKLIFADIES
jgi:hypothetical protein